MVRGAGLAFFASLEPIECRLALYRQGCRGSPLDFPFKSHMPEPYKIPSLRTVFYMVRGAGLEPARLRGQDILSVSWLPITTPARHLQFYHP